MLIVAALALGACTAPVSDQERRARAQCEQLASLLDRYTSYMPFGTGPHLGKSIALDQCGRGNTGIGIAMLEDILRRHRIEIPGARHRPAPGGD